MSVFSRLTDVINANLHSLLDKSEEPEKMLRLMIDEMEQVQVEMRTQAARVIAEQKQLERHQQALQGQPGVSTRRSNGARQRVQDVLCQWWLYRGDLEKVNVREVLSPE